MVKFVNKSPSFDVCSNGDALLRRAHHCAIAAWLIVSNFFLSHSDIFDAMFPIHRHINEVIIQQGQMACFYLGYIVFCVAIRLLFCSFVCMSVCSFVCSFVRSFLRYSCSITNHIN